MTTIAPIAVLPLTLSERSMAPDILRAKATFNEYLTFAEQCEYNVEYVNGEIIPMGHCLSTKSLPAQSEVPYLR